MSSYYAPHFFSIEEFLPPETVGAFGSRAWQFMDSRLLACMDRIRNRYKVPITINNWKTGGPFQYRGFRPPACTEGAPLSQHRFGRACDFDVQGMTAEEVREDIKANPQHLDFNQLMAVELGTNWVHVDVRCIPDPIMWVKP